MLNIRTFYGSVRRPHSKRRNCCLSVANVSLRQLQQPFSNTTSETSSTALSLVFLSKRTNVSKHHESAVSPCYFQWHHDQRTNVARTVRYLSSSAGNNANDNRNGNDDDNNEPLQSPPIWTQLQSPPNIITLARMASTPLLCYWLIQEEYWLAISGCVVAAISDALDGHLAKHHGGSTVLGTYLDPLADKVLINGLAFSLWYSVPTILPTPLIVLWATKDALLLGGTGWYLYQEKRSINFLSNSMATKPLTVTPSTLGKVNTVLQFATLGVGILTPVMSTTVLPPVFLQSLCWITGLTSVGSVLSYMGGAGVKLTTGKVAEEETNSISRNNENKR